MLEAIIHYNFMQNALLSGLLVGLIAPLIGVFLVVRRLSLIADALSHITLSGVAAGIYLGQFFTLFAWIHPIYMGMLFAIGGALLMDKLRKVYRFYQELAIPIILSAGIGLGVVLISLANGFNVDLFGYLFGSLLSVTGQDVWRIAAVSLGVVLVLWFLYKELLYLSFDEEGARVSGVRSGAVHLVFNILVALVIGISMQVVGILLVSALISLPAAAALQLAKSFRLALIYAVIFGEISVLAGLIFSYYLDLASGGTIVVVAVLLLGGVIGWKALRNGKKLANEKGRRQVA
jgi:zinc transport system permease protein